MTRIRDSRRRSLNALAQSERDRLGIRQQPGGGGGGAGPSVVVGQIELALITNVVGTSHSATYDAALMRDAGTTVSAATPLDRAVDTTIDVQERAIDDVCSMGYALIPGQNNGEPFWLLVNAWETILTESCEAATGHGNVPSGNTRTTIEYGGRGKTFLDKITNTQTHTVNSATTDKKGHQLYEFPEGAILIESVVSDIRITATFVTNTLVFGFGTAQATGSGTSLSGTDDDIGDEATMTGSPAAAGGATASRLVPSTATDVTNLEHLFDGTTAKVGLFLNIAPTAAWSHTDTITVQSTTSVKWSNSGDF